MFLLKDLINLNFIDIKFEFNFSKFFTSIPDYINLAVEKNSTVAYLTICLAMFLENIVPPIPSEIIMPLGGFLVYQQKLNFYF